VRPSLKKIGRLNQEDCEFKASPDYIVKPCLKRPEKSEVEKKLIKFISFWYGYLNKTK
jgi:hypothetical protein